MFGFLHYNIQEDNFGIGSKSLSCITFFQQQLYKLLRNNNIENFASSKSENVSFNTMISLNEVHSTNSLNTRI